MRRISLLVLVSLMAAASTAQTVASEAEIANLAAFTGVISEDFPNGKPRIWKEVVDGQPHGLWLEWNTNGTLRFRSYWKEGKAHGKWEYFHGDGTLRLEEGYRADISQGLSRSYHPNGQLASEATYVDGRLAGTKRTWTPDGTPLATETYEDGRRVIDRPELFAPGIISRPESSEWDISFSPDGKSVYFTRRAHGAEKQQIHVSVKDGSNWSAPRVATFSTDRDEGVFITPDGGRAFFGSFRARPGVPASANDANLWVVDSTSSGWGEPRPLSPAINGRVSSGDAWPLNYETGPVLDPEGNLYYWAGSPRGAFSAIYRADSDGNGGFREPTELGLPPNHEGFNSAPVVSPDGRYLLFASYGRPDGFGAEDIYASQRKEDGSWSSPQNLGPDINSSANESAPRFSPDGATFFFSSDRGGSGEQDPTWSIYHLESRFLMLPRR